MEIAIFASVFVIVAGILGRFFVPTEEQLRPLVPEPGAAGHGDVDHGHGHGHGHGHH
jgi:hypothetical protein